MTGLSLGSSGKQRHPSVGSGDRKEPGRSNPGDIEVGIPRVPEYPVRPRGQ